MNNTHSDIKRPAKNTDTGYLNLVAASLISIVLTIALLAAYDHYRYHPVMTVDVELIMQKKLESEQKKIINNASGTFDKEAALRLSQQWASQLANEVSRLSRDYNAIVLVRPAVVEGGIDMTAQVMSALQ